MSDKITVVGIDPGLEGGIACLVDGEIVKTVKMPIISTKLGRRVSAPKFRDIIQEMNPSVIIIEEPQVRPGENILSHLTIGVNFGILFATVSLMPVTLITLPAVVWTRAIHSLITGSKEWETHPSKMKSLKTFRKLYPKSPLIHDGMIDAVLIAFYWLWKEGHLHRIKNTTNSA